MRPNKLGQRTDELGRCVVVFELALVVDELADAVPEGGFEALDGWV